MSQKKAVLVQVPNMERHLLDAFEKIEALGDKDIVAAVYEINDEIWMLFHRDSFSFLTSADDWAVFLKKQFFIQHRPIIYFTMLVVVHLFNETVLSNDIVNRFNVLLEAFEND